MSQLAVLQLIHSLSAAEKRQFKLFTKKQSGDKDYLYLFDLIDQNNLTNKSDLEALFKKKRPNGSLDNTARYLYKLLMDCLVWSRIKEDPSYQQLYGWLGVQVLKERNLNTTGFRELNKLCAAAENSPNKTIQYLLQRERLDLLAQDNFRDMKEQDLIKAQMKTRELLKNIRNTHEHHSLYELLKLRLLRSGKILNEEGKKKLNDLLLSEMGILNGRVKDNMESRKLHLLFQSYFFTYVGEYRSALKAFHELNRLFEKSPTLWRYPPFNYFSALDGILDSLRTNRYFAEMGFYIEKLQQLDKARYPEYFRSLIRKTVLIYRLTILTGTAQIPAAITLIEETPPELWETYQMVDDDKEKELLFYIGRCWFSAGKKKIAQKFLASATQLGKANHRAMPYKAARLLAIIISYEQKELEYLDYEIRSYKRSLQGKQKLLKTERLIFKVIQLQPDLNHKRKNELLWTAKLAALHSDIQQDKFEQQLLKYYDFTQWAQGKFLT